MYIHGRKKAEAEPAPPARDPRDVETIERAVDRDDRYRDDPICSLGLKIKIPEFTAESETRGHQTSTTCFVMVDHVNKRRQIKGKSKNITVEEVINEFDKLRIRCDVVEEEEYVVARFLEVLKTEIADI
ncbi:hypothetical protein Tco_1039029, partial [Tanacetum coccineum]